MFLNFARLIALIILTISLISANFSLRAEEQQTTSQDTKKYNLSICAIFKNEAKFLKEWIEYHRLVGVDHFYLYDSGSADQFKEVLNPYIKNRIVTLIRWPLCADDTNEEEAYKWALTTQISAYENAVVFRTPNETEWLVCLGVHEFLVPPNSDSLLDILERYKEYPGVALVSDYFDASQDYVLPRRRLLVETVELTKAPWQNPQKSVAKTIFKPHLYVGFIWPPYQCLFKDGQTAAVIRKDEMRINFYANRTNGYFHIGAAKDKLHIDNRFLTGSATAELLGMDYEIEDQERAISRFVPELFKRMNLEPSGWGW